MLLQLTSPPPPPAQLDQLSEGDKANANRGVVWELEVSVIRVSTHRSSVFCAIWLILPP